MRFSIFRPVESENLNKADTEYQRRKRFRLIHYSFKCNTFIPLLKWIQKFIGKHMVNKRSDIPDEPFNRNFFLLHDAYEESVREWWFKFKGIDDHCGKDEDREEHIKAWNERKERDLNWYKLTKMNVDLWLTICLEDTAYRELMNVFMFKLYEKMQKEYPTGKPIEHPMYIVTYDNYIPYFIEWCRIKGMKKVHLDLEIGDEPVNGLDPNQIKTFCEQMEEKQDGKIQENRDRISEVHSAGTTEDNDAKASGKCDKAKKVQGSVPNTDGKAGKVG